MVIISKIRSQISMVKILLKSIQQVLSIIWKSSKLIAALSLIVTIGEGLIAPLNMVGLKYFIDSVTDALTAHGNSQSLYQVFFWIGVIFFIEIAGKILNQWNTYLNDRQSRLLNNYISKVLMKKANELDLSFFEDAEFYDNIEKANNQSLSYTLNVLSTLIGLIKGLSTLVGATIIVCSLNPIIFVLALVTTVPMFIITIKLSKKKYDIFSSRMQEARFAGYLQRMIMNYNNIKEIKLYRLGDYIKNVVLSINVKHMNQDKEMGMKQFKGMTLIDIFDNLIAAAFKIYVVLATIRQGLTIGSLTMYISALTNVDQSMRSVLSGLASLYTSNLYLENLFVVLDLKPKIEPDPKLSSFNNRIFNSIEFRNVSFKYPQSENYVLKNINFTIKAGETCALVGLNGSGKTTIIKLLARLYDPTEGAIYIDGKNIREFNIESLHQCMSIVFQDFVKYPFTVKQNIGFGNIEEIDNMEQIQLAAQKSGAQDYIEKLDGKYDTQLEKMWTDGTDLSLGQWQKLAISRAFMSNASILILDEPTASLDVKAEYELFQNFKDLIGNATCVLISHRFSTVRMADNIYVIENGTIIESGSHNHLMRQKGLYCKLFTMQAEAYNLDINQDNQPINKAAM